MFPGHNFFEMALEPPPVNIYYPKMLPQSGKLSMPPFPPEPGDTKGLVDVTVLILASSPFSRPWQILNLLLEGGAPYNRPDTGIDPGTIYMTRVQIRLKIVPNASFVGTATEGFVSVKLVLQTQPNNLGPPDYNLAFSGTDYLASTVSGVFAQVEPSLTGEAGIREIATATFAMPPVGATPLTLQPYDIPYLEWDIHLQDNDGAGIATRYTSNAGDYTDIQTNLLALYAAGLPAGTGDPNVPYIVKGNARLFFNKV